MYMLRQIREIAYFMKPMNVNAEFTDSPTAPSGHKTADGMKSAN